MLRHILVPLDGSALAETILPCVRQYARLTNANVTLLHVTVPADTHRPGVADLASTIQAAEAYLAEVAADFRVDDIGVEPRVVIGSPAATIIAASRTFDLVAMATHGRGGLGRLVFGSVADAVLRGAPVPVLLVRAHADGHVASSYPQRILVPLDGSELAEHALPLAITLARLADADIILTESINWLGELAVSSSYIGAASSMSLLRTTEATASSYLQGLTDRLQRQGLRISTDLRFDNAVSGILTSAAEQRADLIIMCTHGRSGINRLVFGSVAGDILHDAAIPILLVRADVPVRLHATTARVAAPAD